MRTGVLSESDGLLLWASSQQEAIPRAVTDLELVADLERIYARKKAANKELEELLIATGTRLLDLHGIELQQQLVQLGGFAGVLLTQRPAPVDQEPQHRELLVVDHRPYRASSDGGKRSAGQTSGQANRALG